MEKPTIYIGETAGRVTLGDAAAVIIVAAAACLAICGLGCGSSSLGGPEPPPVADAGTPSAAGDAAPVSFRYCNTDLPQNQTKFLAADVIPAPDGGGCEISYGISFGAVTFGCSCGTDACAAAYAALHAQADDCLGREADAGR